MRIQIRPEEIKAFEKELDRYYQKVTRRIAQTVAETAKDVLDDSQALVPEDTGQLAASGRVVQEEELKSRVEYTDTAASFQEYGAAHAPAQPFLTPAVEKNRQPFLRKVKRDLKE